MSQVSTMRCILKFKSVVAMSFCSFGPGSNLSFNKPNFVFTDASKTTLNLVVVLPDFNTHDGVYKEP